MLHKRPGARTPEAKTERVKKVLQLHNAGYSSTIIRKKTGTEIHQAKKWAKELNIPWTA